jgi:uncharacterized membrane protein YkoI
MKRYSVPLLLVSGLLVVGSAQSRAEKVKFEELPRSVQRTIRAQTAGAPVEDIDRENRNGRIVYEVAFKKNGENTELQVYDDGSLVNAPAGTTTSTVTPRSRINGSGSLSGASKVNFDQLPRPVQKAIRAEAADAQVEDVDKGTMNGQTVYEAAFKRGGEHVELRVAEDGTILNPKSDKDSTVTRSDLVQMQFNELPRAVQETVRAHIGRSKLVDIDRDTWNGATVYQVEYLRNGRHEQLMVGQDGGIVQEPTDQVISSSRDRISSARDQIISRNRNEGRKLTMTQLPTQVQNTIRAHAGKVEIEDIDTRTENGRIIYDAFYKKNGLATELSVAEDGKLLDVHRSPVGGTSGRGETGRQRSESTADVQPQLTTLPSAVQNSVRSKIGSARIQKIDKESIRGRTYYEIDYQKDGRKEQIQVREDGVVLDQDRGDSVEP